MRPIMNTLLLVNAVYAFTQIHHTARADSAEDGNQGPTDRSSNTDTGTNAYSYAWSDTRMKTGRGISAILGGGVRGFTSEDDRQAAGTGAVWNLRVTLGSHTPLALDAGYVGAENKVKFPGI